MHSSDGDRLKQFEKAQAHLKQTFSNYPLPVYVTGCPCCITTTMQKALKNGDLGEYIWRAMTTWGTEKDFKSYLYELINYVYLSGQFRDPSIFISKLNHVTHWAFGEKEAIINWFDAYVAYYYIKHIEEAVEANGQFLQAWINNPEQELEPLFPFESFLSKEFNELKFYLSSKTLIELADLFYQWPQDPLSLIDFCFHIKSTFGFEGMIQALNLGLNEFTSWIKNLTKIIEEQFWQTSNTELQKVFSDALEAIKYHLKIS